MDRVRVEDPTENLVKEHMIDLRQDCYFVNR